MAEKKLPRFSNLTVDTKQRFEHNSIDSTLRLLNSTPHRNSLGKPMCVNPFGGPLDSISSSDEGSNNTLDQGEQVENAIQEHVKKDKSGLQNDQKEDVLKQMENQNRSIL